jgi:hypothetical protein
MKIAKSLWVGVVALCLLFIAAECAGQGTTRFSFDGPPQQPPGSAYNVQVYYEAGFSFTPLPGSVGFGRVGSSPTGGRPDDGTGYLQAALGQSVTFRAVNNSPFALIAVDLSEYSTAFQTPLTVHFVGYRQDGSIVTTDLTTDGIIDGTGPLADFQTFHFGPEFSGLTRVEIPYPGWSLDNLVVSVPEPGAGALFLLGTGLVLFRLRKRRADR